MLVRDRMSRRVVTIDADRPIREAARQLLRHRIRQLPVLRDGQLVGIVTHRDLRGPQPPTRAVSSVMTAKPFTIGPDAAVDEAARLLRAYKIGGLPVVEDGRLIGIITVSDVLDALVILSGVGEPTFRLVIADATDAAGEVRVRGAVERGRGELKWLHRASGSRPPLIHLRVKTKRVDDVVAALEADGFEVVRVIAAARALRATRPTPAPRASRSG
jgi:acetoin utilization protein AcuB